MMYLIDYIAYGPHSWYKIQIFKEICRKTDLLTSWLRQQSAGMGPYPWGQGRGSEVLDTDTLYIILCVCVMELTDIAGICIRSFI